MSGDSSGDGAVDARIRVFVQTRGAARAVDYAFLGGAPPQPWWREYRDATAFDHPTVLVASDGSRWKAYLSGIPSARVDAVGTVVRYTLVLDGPCGAPDGACACAAVAAWIDDVAAGTGPGRLSAVLDARFPADDVQRWLNGSTSAPPDEVRGRALAALATLPVPTTATDEPGDWIGGVATPAIRAAFTARVAALVGGAPGRALLLNLVGGPDDAATLVDDDGTVAVLVETADPRLARPAALRPVVEAKKAPAPPRFVPPTRAAVAGVAAAPLMLAVAVLVALGVTLVVTVLVLVL